ncbi:MAG: LysR family transcriptional regulator [Alphaproteobacteria bacterium]|nr:LysR family transcriptional regulator [Alphaproteobacteria bacterium]
MAMDIRQLRYFVGTARAASMTAAAHQLRVTQPALSRQIQCLEDELGVTLFAREARGTTVTDAGAKLLEHAQAVLDRFDLLKEQARSEVEPVTGTVVVGISTGAGETIIPPLMERYRVQHPAVRIRIRQGFSGAVETWLRDHLVDLAVLPSLDLDRLNVNIQPLLKQNLCVIGPRRPPLEGLTECDLKLVAGLPLILPGQPHSVRAVIDQLARQERIPLDVDIEVDGMGVLRGLLRRRLGYTIMPPNPFRSDVLDGTLCAVPIRHPAVFWPFSLITYRGKALSRAAQAMVALLPDLVRDLVKHGEWQHAELL